MAGFIRRYESFPALSVIAQIEGIVIVDLLPAGVFTGRATGKVMLVGEWPKGPLNTPTDVEGESTIRDTFGGFHLSLRNPLSPSTNPYSNGAAFPWLKNKNFQALALVRVDMTLALGVKLQVTSSGAAATGSITAIAGASIIDGETFTLNDGANAPTVFEFDSGGGVLPGRVAVPFTGGDAAATVAASIRTAINGVGAGLAITAAAPVGAVVGLTNDFIGVEGNQTITETVANAGFLVSGMSGGTGERFLDNDLVLPGGTRVFSSVTPSKEFALAQDVVLAAGTDLGTAAFTAFDPTNLAKKYTTRTVSGIPVYSVQGVSEAAPGDVNTANSTDIFRAGIGTGTSLPTLLVAASTGALDGAGANASPLTVLTSNQIDSRYQTALAATLPGDEVSANVGIIACARGSDTIRTALLANAASSSFSSTGRVALTRPPIGTVSATARGSAAPGVGANRGDRNFYCYPHFEQNIPEIASLDPTAAISSPNILIAGDAAMATVLSMLAPELNPGQSTQDVVSGGLLSFIRKLEDGLTTSGQPTKFTMTDYINFKAAGIAALRRDNRLGEWVFQSGVTSVDPSAFPSKAPIKRRRMADFLQDSMAGIALSYDKKANTDERYDSLVGDLTAFLELMLSPNNPPAQRIAAYSIDSKSGNTAQLQGSGIRIVIIAVQLLDSMDEIVLQTEIGETVTVTSSEV